MRAWWLVLAIGCADPNWKHFSQSEFPAFVQEIDFPDGKLSATSSVTFGSWTVSFDPKSPPVIAGDNGTSRFTIGDFIAHNAVVGDRPCILYYMDAATRGEMKRGGHEWQWNLGILTRPWDVKTSISPSAYPMYDTNGIIGVSVPTAIQLQR
jgi:hypothetical protein